MQRDGMLIHSNSHNTVSWENLDHPVTTIPYTDFWEILLDLILSIQFWWLSSLSLKSVIIVVGSHDPLKQEATQTFLNSKQRLLND